MNINNAFPSDYIKGSEVQEHGDITLTIKSVEVATLGQGRDAETKPILHFSDHEKAMVLNKTNANALAAAYGDETGNWTGKKVSLWFDPNVVYGGKVTGGLRVRVPSGASAGGVSMIDSSTLDELERLWWVKGISKETVARQLAYFQVDEPARLRMSQASQLIGKLMEMPDVQAPLAQEDIPF